MKKTTAKNKKKRQLGVLKFLRGNWGYFVVFALILGGVYLGSADKNGSTATLSMSALSSADFQVSVDQLTELYTVASVSTAVNLATSDDVASNYVIVSTMQTLSQTSSGSITKPVIVDVSDYSSGVLVYTVEEGDTMASIAKTITGLTTDQIRWSNGLKTTDIAVGDTLYLPMVAGIVYTVKAGDNLDSIASTYGSDKAKIISVNGLADENIAEGMRIALPGGYLPETERPEYVAPVTTTRTYTYSGSSYNRQDMRIISTHFYASSPGNPYVAGWCTWYAWYWRATDSRSLGRLPSNSWGNARDWADNARSAGYTVSHTPKAGAVFQTSSGTYGHVGVVLQVNADGSVLIREMNYGSMYRVTESTLPASQVGSYWYIY